MSFYGKKGLKSHFTPINQYSILNCISLKITHINQYINIKKLAWGPGKIIEKLVWGPKKIIK